jgi:hypothetical protein
MPHRFTDLPLASGHIPWLDRRPLAKLSDQLAQAGKAFAAAGSIIVQFNREWAIAINHMNGYPRMPRHSCTPARWPADVLVPRRELSR